MADAGAKNIGQKAAEAYGAAVKAAYASKAKVEPDNATLLAVRPSCGGIHCRHVEGYRTDHDTRSGRSCSEERGP